MEFILTEIPGVLVLRPRVFRDQRGYFFESFSQREFDAHVPGVRFVQDNESRSTRGVVRGLHFQRPPHAQAKLVRCTVGAVLDVAVDLRAGSPSYGRHVAVELTDQNHLALYVPRGFAHGFAVLSPEAVFQYKCDNYYAPDAEGGVALDDPALGIEWPVPLPEAVLSPKDTRHPALADLDTPFTFAG